MPNGNGKIIVQVDAVIQATESSIASLKQQISGLQPDSNSWKAVNKEIATMQKNLISLRAKNGTEVTSKKDLSAIEKYTANIEQAGLRAKEIFKNIKFGELKLDPKASKQFEEFDNQLSAIEQNFKLKKEAIKNSLFSDQDFDAQLSKALDLKKAKEVAKSSLDQIAANLENRGARIKQKITELTETLQKSQIETSPLKQQLETLNKIKEEGLLSDSSPFKNFFDANGKMITGAVAKSRLGGKVSDGTKQEVAKYLLSQMGLDNQNPALEELVNSKVGEIAQKIQQILQNIDVRSLLPQTAQDALNTEDTTNANLTNARAQMEAIEGASTRVAGALGEVRVAEDAAAEATGKVVQEAERATGALEEQARSNKNVQTSTEALSSAMQQFRTSLAQTSSQLLQMQRNERTLNSIKMAVTNFMGFYQVLNLVKRGVQEATTHIKQLDTVMNGIAIVSDMNTEDLWNQIDSYSKLAQQYGVSIQGAYEVSKIYYQAGYETADVMTLMNETLKLSKISGLDYATTTNYMMTATRGFHMEVAEAATVVDVYSNLAAHTAVSQQELAEAMSRTASSLEGVGMSFQESSAMIATMEAATRETAYSIGTALKSIASRLVA